MAEAKSSGIGFFGMLGILFIGLKLAGVIDWDWWLVLLPIWAPAAFVLFLVLAMCAYKAWDEWKWRRL